MEQRTFGRTAARMSALGFGGAPAGLTGYLGPWDAAAAESRASVTRAIRRALDLGVTYFDTAPGYGDGLSEEIVGQALGGDRARVFLATKTSRTQWTPAGIRAACEASLRRLGVDHVDLLQFHGSWYGDDDAAAILERGGLETYQRLRDEGKVRFLGLTAEGATGAVERLIASDGFDALMICFNLCYQGAGAFRNRLLPSETLLSRAKAHGMGVVTMRTLTSGVLQRWLARVAPDTGVDWSAALLGFVLSHPQVDVALVGMRTVGEVECNVATVTSGAYRVDLPAIHDGYGG
ncbi:MAG: aldo/keto reductase [Chloroflexi bacterium]|nr:aldo/keto reductase [Chloroflexota bacterium]